MGTERVEDSIFGFGSLGRIDCRLKSLIPDVFQVNTSADRE